MAARSSKPKEMKINYESFNIPNDIKVNDWKTLLLNNPELKKELTIENVDNLRKVYESRKATIQLLRLLNKISKAQYNRDIKTLKEVKKYFHEELKLMI